MKKLFVAILALVMIFSITACGSSGEAAVVQPTQSVPTPAAEESTPEEAAAPEVDAVSSVTTELLSTDHTFMTNDQLEDALSEMLIGVHSNYREMYTLGTCYNDEPLTSSLGFIFVPEEMVFYGMFDAGTGKLLQVQQNSSVSLQWVHMLTPEEVEAGNNYFSICKSMTAEGTAYLYDGSSEEYESIMLPYLETISEVMGATPETVAQLASMGAVAIKIVPDTITIRNMEFMADGYHYLQQWVAAN